MTMDVAPCHTVYIKNLDESVKKEELKRSLYYLFSQFGYIMEVVALKTPKMRGQAFIVFQDINSASNAIRGMQGFLFYKKQLVLSYAKREAEEIARLKVSMPSKRFRQMYGGEQAAPQAATPMVTEPVEGDTNGKEMDMDVDAPTDTKVANQILFLKNLPEETTSMMLSMLFNQFPGFKEVRLVPNRHDIAFVEFDSEGQSAAAMTALQGFKITPTNAMEITYANK
ncbi:U1 small nuclear ribonucleoprotein A-like [Neocloeon triangulifer]|uniref:U1 small nuclear ribonucleoprotein A-like n=1 Tax=Neocloeon triangulifer TaxID=2078957 RepID=UPI00286EEC90|nr:U1 small nuclear ribonucleoprotein A-like [Neocloeon triangulifer]